MSYSLRNIIIGYIAVLAVVLLILFIIYSTLVSQEKEQDKISKSRIALQKLQPAIANVQDIRITYRDYQLKPEQELLNKYQDLVRKIIDDSLTMVMLSGLNTENKNEYLQLATLARKIIDESNAELLQKENNNPTTNDSITRAAASTVDQFKNIAGRLEDKNRQILNISYGNSLSYSRQTFTFVRVILAVLICLMLVSLIFMYKDIQNRKHAEIKLKQFNKELEKQVEEKTSQTITSEQRYRSIIEQATDPIMITDHEGNFLDVNSSLCKQFGYSKEELMAMNVRQLIDPKELEENPMKFEIEVGETVFNDRRMIRRDGTIVEVEANVKMLPDRRMLAIARDVTERKKNANQVIRERNLADSVINSLPGVFFLQDRQGKYLRWNKEFENISGYSAKEIEQLTAFDFFDENNKKIIRAAIDKAFEKGEVQVEATAKTKSGQLIPFYLTGQLIQYEGQPCIIGTGINITERKKVEAENEKVRMLLRERVKELTTLYRSSQILQTEEKPIESLLEAIVSILPQGLQHSDITAARISLGKTEFKTPNFGPGHVRQSVSFTTPDGVDGLVEVVYLEKLQADGGNLFLQEERDLLNMIAEMIRVSLARKHEAEELKKSEANLHAIFDTTDTIYVLLDNNFRVISYNQPAIDFTKKELQKEIVALKDNFMSHFSPERQPVLSEWLKNVSSGDYVMYEQSYSTIDYGVNWYNVKMFPITGSEKKVFGLMLAISDITEKKLLEQEVIDREVQDQKKITRAVLKAQESERNKIGQELHDNVNQILASTKLYLGMAMSERKDNSELIKHSIEFVEEAIAEIRSLSSKEVTPLKEIDLKELLQSLVEQLNYRSGLETDFKYDVPTELFIEDDLKLNIYRIVQEQINNMLKHAEARKASITIQGNAGLLCLRVMDDGVGFDPAVNRKGIGISNMINRVKSYNGELTIDSSPGKGCRTEIKIPC